MSRLLPGILIGSGLLVFFLQILVVSDRQNHVTLRTTVVSPETNVCVDNTQFPGQPETPECALSFENQVELLLGVYEDLLRDKEGFVLVGFPDHANKGDSAIFLGEETLLRMLNKTIIGMTVWLSSYDKQKIRAVLEAAGGASVAGIIFHGGGNFGDLYPDHQIMREHVAADFPDYSIRSFPQTIAFNSEENLQRAVDVFGRHQDLQLAARDLESFDLMHERFRANSIEMLPDAATMLFCLPREMFIYAHDRQKSEIKIPEDVLLQARTDLEAGQNHGKGFQAFRDDLQRSQGESNISTAVSVIAGDWLDEDVTKYEGISLPDRALDRVRAANKFLTSARAYVSDRLHAHILGSLWGLRHVVLEEGEYAKIARYDQTWLQDCRTTTFAHNTHDAAKEMQKLLCQGRHSQAEK
ncbi:hypothetical protein PYCC9005_003058 [Savitreella phatthalungensis]